MGRTLLKIWARAEDSLLIVVLAAMIILAVLQIFLRVAFDQGITWADSALRLLVLWICIAGALVTTRERSHIKIDLLSNFVAPKWTSGAGILINLVACAVCGILTAAAIAFIQGEMQYGGKILFGVPAWSGEIILPIGFALITLRFALNFVASIAALRKKS